jgi:hypothetical protein
MCQLLRVVNIRADFVDALSALRGDLGRADEEVNLFLDYKNLLAQRSLGSLDCLARTKEAVQPLSEGIASGLQLALLIFTLHCVRLQRRRLPLLNVCPFHGFITGPRATSPIGACMPGV